MCLHFAIKHFSVTSFFLIHCLAMLSREDPYLQFSVITVYPKGEMVP